MDSSNAGTYVARYEHRRWVAIAVNVEYSQQRGEVALISDPILMSRWEIEQARKSGLHTEIFPNGGETICRVYRRTPKGQPDELLVLSSAQCSPKDNYVKRLGRIKSFGHARAVLRSMSFR